MHAYFVKKRIIRKYKVSLVRPVFVDRQNPLVLIHNLKLDCKCQLQSNETPGLVVVLHSVTHWINFFPVTVLDVEPKYPQPSIIVIGLTLLLCFVVVLVTIIMMVICRKWKQYVPNGPFTQEILIAVLFSGRK